MTTQPATPARRSNWTLLVIIAVIVACIVLAVCLVCVALTLLGPVISNVFSSVTGGLQ